ncbi:MAG: hypothetical protein R3C60_09290 [Parvularculaceae bacterium]
MLGRKGDPGTVNYRMRGNYYVVDRLFAAAEIASRREETGCRPDCKNRPEEAVVTERESRPIDARTAARPRPVTRLNKNALMLAAGGAALVIFAATSIALEAAARGERCASSRAVHVDTKPTAEGLEALPASYADIRPPLGDPLPGDLGAALLRAQQAALGPVRN